MYRLKSAKGLRTSDFPVSAQWKQCAAIRRALRKPLRSQCAPAKTGTPEVAPPYSATVNAPQVDRFHDERLGAGIFLRRDDAELPRHVRRDVGADVAAPLAAGCRRSARRIAGGYVPSYGSA